MPTVCGVFIRTWGTTDTDDSHTGLTRVTQNYLTNLNMGHASIELILPDTPENWHQVETYLKNTGVPYTREKIETKKVFFVDGKPVLSDKNAFEENVIKIYFSWWPAAAQADKFAFHTLETDLMSGRLSAPIDYKPEWESYLKPDKRYREWVFSKVITLPPHQVLHLRGASEEEIDLLKSYHDCSKIVHDIQAFNFLADRLRTKTGNILLNSDFSFSEKLLLTQFLPQAFTKEQESIPVDVLVAEMNLCSDRLRQIHHDTSTRLYELIGRLNDKEKDRLRNAKIEIEDELKKQIGANKKIAEISPQLTELTAHIITLKEKINVFRKQKKQIEDYINLLAFAKYKEIHETQLALERDKLFALLKSEGYDVTTHEDLLILMLSLEVELLDLRQSKRIFEEELLELGAQEENAKKQALSLGYQKLQSLLDKHITTGQLPANTVNLGLKGENKPGMEPKRMLARMSAFARGRKEFKLISFNCSHTVCEILAAGAGELGWIFLQRELSGSIATPQNVYHNALQYSQSLTPGVAFSVIENENSLQNYFASCAVANFEDTLTLEASPLMKGWSLFKAISAAATCVTLENAKAIFGSKEKPKP